jgi:hypothetical protein
MPPSMKSRYTSKESLLEIAIASIKATLVLQYKWVLSLLLPRGKLRSSNEHH